MTDNVTALHSPTGPTDTVSVGSTGPTDTVSVGPVDVIGAIRSVMRELPGIGRDSQSPQGYSYRGIESITKEAQRLFGRHGVVFNPRVVSWQRFDCVKPAGWTDDHLVVEYTVYGPGGKGDFIIVGPLHAMGRDNSDKGFNKAMTAAFKYALLQLLCIGDSKEDADGDKAEAETKIASTNEIATIRAAMALFDEDETEALRAWWKSCNIGSLNGSGSVGLIQAADVDRVLLFIETLVDDRAGDKAEAETKIAVFDAEMAAAIEADPDPVDRALVDYPALAEIPAEVALPDPLAGLGRRVHATPASGACATIVNPSALLCDECGHPNGLDSPVKCSIHPF